MVINRKKKQSMNSKNSLSAASPDGSIDIHKETRHHPRASKIKTEKGAKPNRQPKRDFPSKKSNKPDEGLEAKEVSPSEASIKDPSSSKRKTKPFIKINKPSPLSLNKQHRASILDPNKRIALESADSESEIEVIGIHKPDFKPQKTILGRRWSVSSETLLLKCLAGNKPAGIHKHFHMANVCHVFNQNNARPRSAKELWAHLENFYDLQAIDEIEFSAPDEWSIFPERHLDLREFQEFELPPSQFKGLIDDKIKE